MQTLPFFPFRSKDYSEYKRIYVEPFLQCQFNFFRDTWPLKSKKIAKIRRSGAGGGDVNQVLQEKGISTFFVMKKLAYMVFWMRRGESKEENQQVRLNTMQKLLKLKIVKEC